MATGNNDLLNRLRKLLAEAADTSDARQPWQELFGRQDTVPSRAIRAAEAVKDFAGSWAASYATSRGQMPITEGVPTPDIDCTSLLGQRGYPEINFVPYNWNTNAFGKNGPSLVGHPVSFEVHGHTLKQYDVQDKGYLVDLTKNVIVAKTDWEKTHGEFDGTIPYWLVVTDPGGGLVNPDGSMGLAPTRDPILGGRERPKHKGTARYEIFRIANIEDRVLTLHDSKRLSDYFLSSVPGQAEFGSVIIIKPKIARLAPMRDSEFKSWAVLPPDRAAIGEYQIPYLIHKTQGNKYDYNLGVTLPIPKPLPLMIFKAGSEGEESAWLPYPHDGQGAFDAVLDSPHLNLGAPGIGRFRVKVEKEIVTFVDERMAQGQTTILHISEMNDPANAPATDSGVRESLKRLSGLLGYHEVVAHDVEDGKYWLECRFHPVINPETGRAWLGHAMGIAYDTSSAFSKGLELKCTFHQPIHALYSPNYNTDDDDLESARLTGLIDPKEVGRSLKVHGTNDVPQGGYSGRADRAIPNTAKHVDPGSLLDLGFRMVLFTGANGRINWEKPLASRELILDPTKPDEHQYVDVDYASGVVKFSHTPVLGGDIFVDEDGEPLIYAAFVPYSMEGGQRGVGVRMTGGDLHSANLGYPVPHQSDVFSQRKVLRPSGDSQTISLGGDLRFLKKNTLTSNATVSHWENEDFPYAGYFDLVDTKSYTPYFDTHEPSTVHASCTYTRIVEDGDYLVLKDVRWLMSDHGPNLTVNTTQAALIRHRSDISNRFDTTYGSSARTDVVRLAYGEVTYNQDGSTTLLPTAVAGPAEELRSFYPLGMRGSNNPATTEVSRFHFDPLTQRWTTNDPPWMNSGHEEPPTKSHEIGVEVSRGRLYTNWEFSPYGGSRVRPVLGKVAKIGYSISSKILPVPRGFTVTVSKTEDANAGIFNCFSGGSKANLMSGVIEGSVLSSLELSGKDNLSDNDTALRYLFAIKANTTKGLESEYNGDRRGAGAANPVDWVSVSVPAGAAMLPIQLVSALNSTYGAYVAPGQPFYAKTGPNGGVVIQAHGRQVQALPSQPYLASKEFDFKNGPVVINQPMKCLVDLRTAMKGESGSWIHFELTANHVGAPVDCKTPIELAEYLNEISLYHSTTLQKLKNANFLGSKLPGSENPALQTGHHLEHHLLFVAHDDPRFPSHLNPDTQIALLCGGRGDSYIRKADAEDDTLLVRVHTPSVLVELDNVKNEDNPSLLDFLGGEFEVTLNTEGVLPRCGLFWGMASGQPMWPGGGMYPTGASEGPWDNPSLGAQGNLKLGYRPTGTYPLGRFCGSFEINGSVEVDDLIRFELLFPTGQTSDWFNDQSSAGVQRFIEKGDSLLSPTLSPDMLEPQQGGGQGQSNRDPQSGWLGRWAWPHRIPRILAPEDMGKEAGISDVLMSFGTGAHNEDAFSKGMYGQPTGRNSVLVEMMPTFPAQWKRPNNVWDDISYGDIVTFMVPSSAHQSVTGRLIHKTPSFELDSRGMPVEEDFLLYVLASTDLLVKAGDPLYPSGWGNGPIWFSSGAAYMGAYPTSIVPSPVWGKKAAVAHLISNRFKDSPVYDSLPYGDTSFFKGGDKHPNALSSVLVGGGRVSLLSALGVTEPTGFALHNLIQGLDLFSTNDPGNAGQTSVYIESGAWTTVLGTKSGHAADRQSFWGEMSQLPGSKNSVGNPYTGNTPPRVGGVGGVRISGDAHLWLENIRPLTATSGNAYIVDTGPVLSGQVDWPSGHMPDQMTTMVPARGFSVQEATIQIGMTSSDLVAFKGLLAKGNAWAASGGPAFLGEGSIDNLAFGMHLFRFGQLGNAEQGPLLMPSLAGSYIHLKYGPDTTTVTYTGQTGMFRIVAAPMIRYAADRDAIEQAPKTYYDTGTPHLSDGPNTKGVPLPRLSRGRDREAQVVAVMTLRIEGFIANGDSFEVHGKKPLPPDFSAANGGDGLWWTIYRDGAGEYAIWTGDVVDPGGAPTGAPASIRGLTLDPRVVAGKDSLKAELIPLGVPNNAYGYPTWYQKGGKPSGPDTNYTTNQSGDVAGLCDLLGIHDQVGRFGKHFSRAFFSMRLPANVSYKTPIPAARMVVLGDSAGLVDGFPDNMPHGDFGAGDAGRIGLGYPRRLGPGVLMDGGLGLVQATAFRAAPRNKQTEHIGQLTVWGRGAYPFYNGLKPADIGMELPSTFNTAEFHGEVSIANPQGRFVFESPWAAEGLVANMMTAQFASERYVGPHHFGWKGLQHEDNSLELVLNHGGLGMMDTLFPYLGSGIVFRTPGTTVYERAFRSLDATGSNPGRKTRAGSHNRSGIPGLGIPFQGEVLLLPQGPPSQGKGRADFRYGWGQTPLDIPLYEFINGTTRTQVVKDFLGNPVEAPDTELQGGAFGINLAACVGGSDKLTYCNATVGPVSHAVQMGTISQAYRHSNSREMNDAYFWSSDGGERPKHQIRLLDGMIIEDTTNGTFYTVGSVGRWKFNATANSALGLLGDGTRSPTNGSMVAIGADKYQYTDNSGAGPFNYTRRTVPEVLYDLTDSYDPSLSMDDLDNGFGDRSDSGRIRRPLSGHDMRITANVEFVPVLGPRGVRGGLLPPRMYLNLPNGGVGVTRDRDWGWDADAFFYDLDYQFKAGENGDVGKMLYICGTHTYEHTGWWVIIGVLSSDMIGKTEGGSLYAHAARNKVEMENFDVDTVAVLRKYNWSGRVDRAVPPDNSRSDDWSGILPLRERSPYLTAVADQRTNLNDGTGFFGVPHDNPSAVGKQVSFSDFVITHMLADGQTFQYVIPRDEITGVWNADNAAVFLNADDRSNGVRFLDDAFGGPSHPQLILWTSKEGVLTASYKLTTLLPGEREQVLTGAAQVQVEWRTRTDGQHGSYPTGPHAVGFAQCSGHSLAADRTEGDRNNACPLFYKDFEMNVTHYYEPAARGLRWVFSHPLSEENVGSYVHLTKPNIYRFGVSLPTQQDGLSVGEMTTLGSTWTSGHQSSSDVTSQKRLDLTTDIFRVNRCPNTSKLLVGGDCEVYFTEFHRNIHSSSDGGVGSYDAGFGQGVMYSPLGVHGSWPDTDTGELTQNKLNYPVTYALQPIAREKIVVVSPSSAKSSVVFARGAGDQIDVPIGPQGVGPMVATGNAHPFMPESSYLMEPWQLVSRADMTRTAMAKPMVLGNFDGRVEINNANLDLVEVSEMLSMAEAEVVDQAALIADLIAKKTQLNDYYGVLLGEVAGLLTDIAQEAADMATASGDLAALEATPAGQNVLIKEETLQGYIEQLDLGDKWFNEVSSSRSAAVAMLDMLSDQFASHSEKLENAEEILLEKKADLDGHVDNKNGYLFEIANLQQEIADVHTLIAGLADQISIKQGDLSEIDANLDWEADYEGDDPIAAELVATIQKLNGEIIMQHQHISDVEAEIAVYQAKIAEVQGAIVAANAAWQAAKVDVANLETEMASIEAAVQEQKDALGPPADQPTVDLLTVVGWKLAFNQANKDTWNASYGLHVLWEALAILASQAATDVADYAAEVKEELNDLGIADARDLVQEHWDNITQYVSDLWEKYAQGAETMADFNEKDKLHKAAVGKVAHLAEILNYWQDLQQAIAMSGGALSPYVAAPSTYVWTPSGEWWQLYQPSWDKHGPDASAPPPTLRVDLTESFTQAIGPGAGLNTPHPSRFPRGVRLNRIWVNFGSWGTPMGSKPTRLASETPGYVAGLEDSTEELNAVLDVMHVTFNLVLEIPGSQARFKTDEVHHPQGSGTAGFPFGGRAPTAATNHPSNAQGAQSEQIQAWPGGTIVVPLYINREAGDMMPNVMERFVTAGPKARYAGDLSANLVDPIPDWSGGHYEWGFGASSLGDDPSVYSYGPLVPVEQRTGWDGTKVNVNEKLFVNSFNPVVWGGMDFAPHGYTQNDGVFEHPWFARVQASVFPRQSRVGGGLRSEFTSGLIPDGSVFSGYSPHSLSAAALTGLTFAHSAQLKDPPTIDSGGYNQKNLQGGFSSPHGFTVALTPVGDGYEPPMEDSSGLFRAKIKPGMSASYGDTIVATQGRTLKPHHQGLGQNDEPPRPFKVGNWLDIIKDRYGIYAPSGSMLPPGSRVFLEIAVGPGPGAKEQTPRAYCGAGTWVGSIKLGFDVETGDGTAWSADVNVLGDEEG